MNKTSDFLKLCLFGSLALTLSACGDNNSLVIDQSSLNPGLTATCGDGILDSGEACDDHNLANGDGCNSQCQIEAIIKSSCGNGAVEKGEICDDANLVNGDGCNSQCQAEVSEGPQCGNGIVEENEVCDDGNKIESDACRNNCTLYTLEEHVWSQSFSLDKGVIDSFKIKTDAEGNTFIGGNFRGTINLGGNDLVNNEADSLNSYNTDIFIAKFDSNGQHLWSKSFPLPNIQSLNDLVIDSEKNIVITGGYKVGDGLNDPNNSQKLNFGDNPNTALLDWVPYQMSPYLAKFDSNGNHLWSKSFQEDSSNGSAIAVNAAGQIYLAGNLSGNKHNFGGQNLTSQSATEVYLAKFSPSGDHIFSKRFAGIENQYASQIIVDFAGNVVLSGVFNGDGDINFDGNILQNQAPYYYQHSFVAKFNPEGKNLWAMDMGGAQGSAQVTSVSVDTQNHLRVSGYCDAPFSIKATQFCQGAIPQSYLLELGQDGELVNGLDLPAQTVRQTSVNLKNELFLLGDAATASEIQIGDDKIASASAKPAYLAQLDAQEDLIWGFSFENGNSIYDGLRQTQFALDTKGNVVLAGQFSGSLSFGGDLLVDTTPKNQNFSSFYIVKLKAH